VETRIISISWSPFAPRREKKRESKKTPTKHCRHNKITPWDVTRGLMVRSRAMEDMIFSNCELVFTSVLLSSAFMS